MAMKRAKGLYKRGQTWHIDRMVRGERIRESTGESEFDRAFEVLTRRVNQARDGHIHGKRPQHAFLECYERYMKEFTGDGIVYRKLGKALLSAFGPMPIEKIDESTLRVFLDQYRQRGCKSNTIRMYQNFVSAIMNKATTRWRNPNGTTWLARKPDFSPIDVSDELPPYPITWAEEDLLLSEMRDDHKRIVQFALNTGLRDNEVRALRWDWEYLIPELNENVFRITDAQAKNDKSRLVVLNSVAREIVERQRGLHPTFVFVSRMGSRYGSPLCACYFRRHREWAVSKYEERIGSPAPDGFRTMRFHDLRHTFGHRLLAAGASIEVRAALFGHALPRGVARHAAVTAHYSVADYMKLRAAVEQICDSNFRNSPTLPMLRLIKKR